MAEIDLEDNHQGSKQLEKYQPWLLCIFHVWFRGYQLCHAGSKQLEKKWLLFIIHVWFRGYQLCPTVPCVISLENR